MIVPPIQYRGQKTDLSVLHSQPSIFEEKQRGCDDFIYFTNQKKKTIKMK